MNTITASFGTASTNTENEVCSSTNVGRVSRIQWMFGLAVLLLMLFKSTNAYAGLCVTPPETGSWRNSNSATRSITSIAFRMECRSANWGTCSGNICTTTVGAVSPHYFIKLWGKCYPQDCYWGEAEGTKQTGAYDGWYRFNFDQGFARRYVWVKTYPQWPGWLRLYIWTDFADPRRADYAIDEWFRR